MSFAKSKFPLPYTPNMHTHLEIILISVVFPMPFLPTKPYLLPNINVKSASFSKTLKNIIYKYKD